MKLLTIGPRQTAGEEAEGRQNLQAAALENYVVLTPKKGEGNVKAALRILRESKSVEFDVVSAQDPFWSGLIAMCIARRSGKKLNVQVHADIDAQSFVNHILAQVVLRHADSVRVVSEKIKKQVERIGAQPPITVLPVFIDMERFRDIERRPGGSMVWIGRFEKEKDPLLAVEIASKAGAHLIMVGKGSLEPQLRKEATNVEFPGWVDPAPHLSRASLLLNTSPAESFGVTIVEALAAGVPVVSMDVGIAKEAGAIVVPKEKLADMVVEVLKTNPHAELKLNLLSKEDWIKKWKESF